MRDLREAPISARQTPTISYDVRTRKRSGPDTGARAIQALDEHWDGKGSPSHLAGRNIPLLARILCLSQTLEVFATAYGMYSGFDVAQERSGRWFDPELVHAALSFENDTAFWRD